MPLDPLLAFSRQHKSSVVPTLSAIIGHAIRQSYAVGRKEISCYAPVDLRPVFDFESGGNSVTNFTLLYTEEMDRLDVGERARLLRAETRTQIRPENLYANMADLRTSISRAFETRLPVEVASKIAVHIGRKKDTKGYTYGISYAGKACFEDAVDPYVRSLHTAAGSYSYPLWILAYEYKGIIRMTLVQSFESDVLATNIYQAISEYIPGTSFADLGHKEFDSFLVKDVPRMRA